jgi:GntR family transcriptional repressor for pyruvate dehydrogenase complex
MSWGWVMFVDSVFIPLERKNRSSVVFEALCEKIRGGFWKHGERIWTEAELVTAFNVSRSTIREALNLLKARNFVYTVPGLGTFVSDSSPHLLEPVRLNPENIRDVLQVMEFRIGYEPYCASLAAIRITDAEVQELAVCVSRQEAGVSGEDLAEFAELDTSFHSLIAKATRNTLFVHSFELIREHLLKQQVLSASYAERREKALQYHQQIIQAFKERDRRQAERVMREHVRETKNAISTLLGEEAR